MAEPRAMVEVIVLAPAPGWTQYRQSRSITCRPDEERSHPEFLSGETGRRHRLRAHERPDLPGVGKAFNDLTNVRPAIPVLLVIFSPGVLLSPRTPALALMYAGERLNAESRRAEGIRVESDVVCARAAGHLDMRRQEAAAGGVLERVASDEDRIARQSRRGLRLDPPDSDR